MTIARKAEQRAMLASRGMLEVCRRFMEQFERDHAEPTPGQIAYAERRNRLIAQVGRDAGKTEADFEAEARARQAEMRKMWNGVNAFFGVDESKPEPTPKPTPSRNKRRFEP